MNPLSHCSNSIAPAIGNTPMVALHFKSEGATVYAKCEFLNPSGSIKDRLARAIFDDAEQRRLLRPESIVLECSSGNTGVALAMIGAIRGYRVLIALSEKASKERRKLIQQLGGEVLLFPAGGYRKGIELVEHMAAGDARYFLPRQFENPLNARDHAATTGIEILRQAPGTVNAFVSGYGTGGTLAGVSSALRRANPNTLICAMEPAEAALLTGEAPCSHFIEGVSDGFIPPLLQGVAIDEAIKIPSDDAVQMAQRLACEFGLLVGTSSGANIAAALKLAARLGPDCIVVTLLCDRAERYFSTALFGAQREAAPARAACPLMPALA